MSGIFGIIHNDGSPVDPSLLKAMAGAASSRGPDGVFLYCMGNAGLGFLALHSTPQSQIEKQPLAGRPESQIVVADVRLDNRPELIKRLSTLQRPFNQETTDAELVLAAYQQWGAAFPEKLLGAFAIAIWERDRQRLLLARDHLGARPCYHFTSSNMFAFASEIQQLRQIPAVTDQLNERRIAAQIASLPTPQTWTFFSDIQQLAPAHTLLVQEGKVTLQRYWSLDPQKLIGYKNEREYTDHFLDIFSQAVAARLRSPAPPSSMLSGGLDSSAVVALAADHYQKQEISGRPHTYTWDFTGDQAIQAADEQQFARSVADFWHLPLTRIPAYQYWPLSDLDNYPIHADSPYHGHYHALIRATLMAAKRNGSKVLLTGHPADLLTAGLIYSYSDFFLSGRWKRLVHDLQSHARLWDHSLWNVSRRRLLRPLLSRGRQRIFGERSVFRQLPGWITPQLIKKARFEEMREEIWQDRPGSFHSYAQAQRYNSLTTPFISEQNIWLERLATSLGMEFRHPWLDMRLFEFSLAVPQDRLLNAGRSKYVVRKALNGLLPENVRLRLRKTIPYPLLLWSFRHKATATIEKLLDDPLVAQMGFVDPLKLSNHYQSFLKAKINEEHPLWYTLALETWLKSTVKPY